MWVRFQLRIGTRKTKSWIVSTLALKWFVVVRKEL